jgi:hypothetical protein
MNRSEQINELAAALAKAQAAMKNPTFDKANPHFKNKYASLASIRDAVIPILAKEGIAVMQWLSSEENCIRCETVLSHNGGQWASETLAIPVARTDAQGFASAATYAKRIGLQSAICVTGDEDDDGEAASKAKPSEPITARGGARERLSQESIEQIDSLASRILDQFEVNGEQEAYKAYLEARPKLRGDADLQAAFWDRFNSKQRSTLKKFLEHDRNKELVGN